MTGRKRLTEGLSELLESAHDERAGSFTRGLAIGALVGAAIAGSALWQRRQAAASDRAARSVVDPPGQASSAEEPPRT